MNAIKGLFSAHGVFNAVGLVTIGIASMASPTGQTMYIAMVLGWVLLLAIALALLAIAFRRRLLLGFHQ